MNRPRLLLQEGKNEEEIDIPNFLKDGDGKTYNIEVTIKKSDFLERIKPLLEQANQCVRDALAEAAIGLDDLNRIVLVGGSTKADWIKESIRGLYPPGEERDPFVAADVDVIVSQGAAVHGASLLTMLDKEGAVNPEDKPEMEVEGIVSHHLGIELEGQKFGLVIPKGLPLNKDTPSQVVTRVFGNPHMRDSIQITAWKTQKAIDVEEDAGAYKAKDDHYVTQKGDNEQKLFEYVGEILLKGIPKANKGTLEVSVKMELNTENILFVSASCSGAEGDVKLDVGRN